MGNIYVKSCSKEGNTVRYGAKEKIYFDASEAQFKDPFFKQAFDLARDAYQAIGKKQLNNLEILNITDNCIVISGTFKYGHKDFKLNVFKNKMNRQKTSSYSQILPLNCNDGDVYLEAEFRGTRVAKLLEKSLEHYIDETLG